MSVHLLSKFIERALSERSEGKLEKYKVVLNEVKSPSDQIDRWLLAGANCVSSLNHELIHILFSLPLHTIGQLENEEALLAKETLVIDNLRHFNYLLDCYIDFCLNVISHNPNKYVNQLTDIVIGKRFSSFAAPYSMLADDEEFLQSLLESTTFPVAWDHYQHVRSQILIDRMHELLLKVVDISPSSIKSINDKVEYYCPNVYVTNLISINNFISNTLFLAELLPSLHHNLVEVVFNYIVALDLHSFKDDDDEGKSGDFGSSNSSNSIEDDLESEVSEFDSESASETDSEASSVGDEEVLILNSAISLLTSHVKKHEEDIDLISLLFSNSQLMNSTQLRYSPAVIFYALTLKKDYLDMYISFLVLNIFDGQNSTVYRLNCCCFLTILSRFKSVFPGSFVSANAQQQDLPLSLLSPPPSPLLPGKNDVMELRDTQIDDSMADVVSQTLLLLSQYLHCCLDLQNVGPTFYHIINTLMYIFCFHHTHLIQADDLIPLHENHRMKWWNYRGGFTRILINKHYPLEQCSRDIVQVFLDKCRTYGLFYYAKSAQSHEQKHAFVPLVVSESKKFMDLFYFPFDTHILDLDIGDQFNVNYREWKN